MKPGPVSLSLYQTVSILSVCPDGEVNLCFDFSVGNPTDRSTPRTPRRTHKHSLPRPRPLSCAEGVFALARLLVRPWECYGSRWSPVWSSRRLRHTTTQPQHPTSTLLSWRTISNCDHKKAWVEFGKFIKRVITHTHTQRLNFPASWTVEGVLQINEVMSTF